MSRLSVHGVRLGPLKLRNFDVAVRAGSGQRSIRCNMRSSKCERKVVSDFYRCCTMLLGVGAGTSIETRWPPKFDHWEQAPLLSVHDPGRNTKQAYSNAQAAFVAQVAARKACSACHAPTASCNLLRPLLKKKKGAYSKHSRHVMQATHTYSWSNKVNVKSCYGEAGTGKPVPANG